MDNGLQKRRPVMGGSNYTSLALLKDEVNSEGITEEEVLNRTAKLEKSRPSDIFLKPGHQFIENENKRSGNKYLEYYKKNQILLNLVLLVSLSMFTRYYHIGRANKPIWDEVHFGKFGSHYLRGTFYHDVHPPLGKMLVALGGKLAGYDGTFKFEGEVYNEKINYVAMRIFHATFGMALVPIAYLTAIELGMPNRACLLASGMILFDNGFTVISRFILLDSMLLMFIAMSVYFLVAFHTTQAMPFSNIWWMSMASLGVFLGLASSVKWIGLFAVALVGLYTLEDLWTKYGDLKMPKTVYVYHWIARFICLIFIPITVYILCFRAHFAILNNSGPGDGVMDSLFQARLNRNKILNSPAEMMYFSNITLRSGTLDGGLLHSHPHQYPLGSGEQQITCYGYKDSNNDFMVLQVGSAPPQTLPVAPSKVQDQDLIRLRHVETGKHLRVQPSHDAIVSLNRAYEVSGSLDRDNHVHQHEIWRVEIVDDLLGSKPTVVQTLSSRFRLRNPATGCLLASAENKYPSWGFNQREVYCVKDPTANGDETLWNVEELRYAGVPPGPRRHIPAKFLNDFARIHKAMWSTNNALTPDEDKYDHLTSHAWEWPLMRRGIRMCGWGDSDIKYYMLSNPFVVWLSSLAILVYLILLLYYYIRMKRHIREWLYRKCQL
ncbi:Protein O-mannosyltransferase 2, variant 3 [Entomophthora muscae]|uniref:Protein O-mannosyltransferase 2, variant 3 n=1 Tax=Entomophthora muscae TaxID=34485 RepID=A0ACC2SPI7_9FUNG|nr:Protein O-mannosyltransferase 2, variant 3 [Entomophthora muscae]